MRQPRQQYFIPGIYGELKIAVVSRKTIRKHSGPIGKGHVINGLYSEKDHVIYIASELPRNAKITTFWHELSHHILDAAKLLEDESAADMAGGYLGRLIGDVQLNRFLAEII